MVRKITFYLASISLILVWGCTQETFQEEKDRNHQNAIESTAQWVTDRNAKGGHVIGIKTRAGHSKKNCDGSCSQTHKHIDCQGTGKECPLFGNIELEPIVKSLPTSSGLYTGKCLYPEDISDYETFSMPARSFYMEKEQMWLNIPEQILQRHPESRCFIIKSITFTVQPLHPNA